MAQTDGRSANSPLVPPDEQFWQRYSPHAEFPLSGAGSLALHLLLFGILGLLAWLGAILFTHGSRSLPVEAVRLDLGGGGGDPHGEGDGPNNGAPVEASGDQPKEGATENAPLEDDSGPKTLNMNAAPRVITQFNDDSPRSLPESNPRAERSFQNLKKVSSRLRVPDRKPSGRGQGGKGSGGGSGDGRGKGVGNGEGEGHGALTKREKRMLRWAMLFRPQSPKHYVAQLRGLGAILAFPIAGTNDHKVVRDLSARPARLLAEDITQLHRIYWYDNNPDSVAQVMNVLGIRLPAMPDYFIAFMPEEVEKKLYEREDAYLKSHYRGATEDDITETKFRLVERGETVEPQVSELKVKKR